MISEAIDEQTRTYATTNAGTTSLMMKERLGPLLSQQDDTAIIVIVISSIQSAETTPSGIDARCSLAAIVGEAHLA